MISQQESDKVAENMIKHGGHFVKALGEALKRADSNNQGRINRAWPIYWEKYKDWPEESDGEIGTGKDCVLCKTTAESKAAGEWE